MQGINYHIGMDTASRESKAFVTLSHDHWAEVMRLGRLAALATRLDDRTSYCADLLAELGLIHPTPDGKWDWMHRGKQ